MASGQAARDGGAVAEYVPPATFFRRLRAKPGALKAFGFVKQAGGWAYSAPIVGGALVCTFTIDTAGRVAEAVADPVTGDEYVLYRVASAAGAFAGWVRHDVMVLMEAIAGACFEREAFKTALARQIIKHAQAQWGETPEFLWPKFPDFAVLRRQDTRKWYALVARLPADKVGGAAGGLVEIVNLRRSEAMTGEQFRPAYHMNKRTWATIVSEGSLSAKTILPLLAHSRDKAL